MTPTRFRAAHVLGLPLLAALAIAAPSSAIQEPPQSAASALVFRDSRLDVSQQNQPATMVTERSLRTGWETLRAPVGHMQVDLRTGRLATLLAATPLIPGKGYGNKLSWSQLGLAAAPDRQTLETVAWAGFQQWLISNREALAIDPAELVSPGRVTVISPDYIHVWSPRRVGGIAVDGAYVQAVIRYGNLVLFGATNWGDVDEVPIVRLSAADANELLLRRVAPFRVESAWKQSELVWVPIASGPRSLSVADIGRGLEHRLAWKVRPQLEGVFGQFEALVDAADGTVLSFQDTMHYAASQRQAIGGVYPVSNDNVNPDGVEQPGWPMPFSDVVTPLGTLTTDAGGNLPYCIDGTISSSLSGPFMKMADVCGAISLSGTGNLDFGASAGTDCITPGVGGAGNTHASRSGFYEMNRIKAMARGQWPAGNSWLTSQLTANMNQNQTCNAGWNGATVNFFKSGGGCNNTGEIAAVFDHEWGHGMDNNDAVPTVSSPGEGIADIYAALRLETSCIGRHFRNTNCAAYGNACLDCTGVRDIDWDKHNTHLPFTIANADACSSASSNGPCGGSVHCEGQVYSQSVWDLWKRDLVGAPWNLSNDVAHEIVTQLSYRGAAGVGAWYACTNGTGGCGNPNGCGCAAANGYMHYITADDDNGNLADGTPHMQAIFNAFNRHGIACTTPTVTEAGCVAVPIVAPILSGTAGEQSVSLGWTPSVGAASYRVYRTDSPFTGAQACSFGKELVTTTNALSFNDLGLQNGKKYAYQVIPVGNDDECFQTVSNCLEITPTAGASASLSGLSSLVSVAPISGDGDVFLDNCETARVAMPLSNTGSLALTNVRVVGVTSPSHSITVLTPLPATVSSSLLACGQANASIDFVPSGVNAGDVLTLQLEFTSDELAPLTRVLTVTYQLLERDFQNQASKTFTFETDTEGWTTTSGVFARASAGGGASSTAFYMQSSSNLDNQCDVVRSPIVRLSQSSSLTMFTNFNIENISGGQWWDRANVGVQPVGSSNRTLVTPGTGRLYNASGVNGVCGTEGQAGWAGNFLTWASSAWSAANLQSATFAGTPVQLEVRYGTDSSVNAVGFRYDQVTLTDFDLAVADTRPDVCGGALDLLSDGFENRLTLWSAQAPQP